MKLFPETALFLCIGSCIVLYLLFKFLNSRSTFVNRKNSLLKRYRKLRAQSLKLQEALSKHILSSNADKDIFMDTTTYSDYSRYLQKNHIQNLSDRNYVKLKNSNNRLLFKSTALMLDAQEAKLKQAENNLSNILNNNNDEPVNNYNIPLFN